MNEGCLTPFSPAEVREVLYAERNPLIRGGLSLALLVAICMLASFGVAELTMVAKSPVRPELLRPQLLHPASLYVDSLYLVRLVQMVFGIAVLSILQRPGDADNPLPLSIFAILALYLTSSCAAALSGEFQSNLTMLGLLTLGAGLVFPWGLWAQALVAGGAAAAAMANLYLLDNPCSGTQCASIGASFGAVLAASLALALLRQRSSERAAREQLIRQSCDRRVLEVRRNYERLLGQQDEYLEQARVENDNLAYAFCERLNTPLDSSRVLLNALRKDCERDLSTKASYYLGRLLDNNEAIGDLTAALLQLSAIDKAPLQRQKIDLGQLAREVWQECEAQRGCGPLELKTVPGLTVTADPVLLRSLLEKLIDNALKFAIPDGSLDGSPYDQDSAGDDPQTGVIELGGLRRRGETIYYLRDHGPGFEQALAGEIFQAFVRGNAGAVFDESPGLGLSAVRRIAEKHGGKAWAEGKPGEGATFYFTL